MFTTHANFNPQGSKNREFIKAILYSIYWDARALATFM